MKMNARRDSNRNIHTIYQRCGSVRFTVEIEITYDRNIIPILIDSLGRWVKDARR